VVSVIMQVKVERYPDGRIKSVSGSTKEIEFWIDDDGACRSVRKNLRLGQLLDRILNNGFNKTNGR
jgi:hypothetical protein